MVLFISFFSVTAESTYLTSSDTFPPISLLFPSSSPLLPPTHRSPPTRSPVVFLERLQSYTTLPPQHVTHLGALYAFHDTPNAELRWRFYEVALLDPASPAAQAYAAPAARWVTGTDGTGVLRGRMKFCRPTFRAVARADCRGSGDR